MDITRRAGALAVALAALTAMATPAAAQLNIAAEARVTLLSRAYNAAGQKIYEQLAASPGNVVFSPYSVGAAVSMAISGAGRDTASEMMRAMSMRMSSEAIDAANAEMMSILNGYDQGASRPPSCASGSGGSCEARPGGELMSQCPPGLRLVGSRCVEAGAPQASARFLAANALMLHQRGDLISADFRGALKNKYAAEVFQNASLDEINGWVAKKTEGKIPRILDKIDDAAAATLVNAVYFKARWASSFEPKLTRDEAFSLTRSQKADVAFMHRSGEFSLVSRGGYKALRLNYEVPELGLVIVLPDDVEGAAAVARRLGTNELTELFGALRDGKAARPVAVALPRFKAGFTAGLKAALQQAGIRKAFDENAADFSGMTGHPPGEARLYIGDVVHRAVIEASEESTEAAASTAAVTMEARAAPPPPMEFRADHPFLFYVVDDATGAILFEGRIADPRG